LKKAVGLIVTPNATLVLEKIGKKLSSFIEYFRSEWLTSHNGWYEGMLHFTPITNNALEATNRVINDENTFRERLPLPRFKVLAFETV